MSIKQSLGEIQVGDVVSCLLHPAGPGTEEYRRSHGHACELKITKIDDAPLDGEGYFDGEYHIKDLESLFDWITLNEGVNDGSQIGERKIVPDISVGCIEMIVKRAPLTVNAEVEGAVESFVEAVGTRRFERDEPGTVSVDDYARFVAEFRTAVLEVAEEFLQTR